MSQPFETSRAATPVWAWAWACAWALLVWGLGGETLSEDSTSRVLGPLIRWLLPGISEGTSAQLLWGVRRTAHVVEYAVLSLLVFRALLASRPNSLRGAAWTALCLTSAFAAADETRQSLLETRMGSIGDVALDTAGATLGIVTLLCLRSAWPERFERIGIEAKPPEDGPTGERK